MSLWWLGLVLVLGILAAAAWAWWPEPEPDPPCPACGLRWRVHPPMGTDDPTIRRCLLLHERDDHGNGDAR